MKFSATAVVLITSAVVSVEGNPVLPPLPPPPVQPPRVQPGQPGGSPPKTIPDRFTIDAIHSLVPLLKTPMNAARGGLFIHLADSQAQCDEPLLDHSPTYQGPPPFEGDPHNSGPAQGGPPQGGPSDNKGKPTSGGPPQGGPSDNKGKPTPGGPPAGGGAPSGGEPAAPLPKGDPAFFYVKEEELYLYTSKHHPVQKVTVDKSSQGQGKLGYITGKDIPALHVETKGWKVDKDGWLTFNGATFLACPKPNEEARTLFVNIGKPEPLGLKLCQTFTSRVVKEEHPVRCIYTE